MSDVTSQFIWLSIYFSSMLNIASSDSLVDKLTLISDLIYEWFGLRIFCQLQTYQFIKQFKQQRLYCISLIWWYKTEKKKKKKKETKVYEKMLFDM